MKFPYPDLTSSSVNGMRVYETPQGNFYPSVTTVLGNTQPEEKVQALKKWQMSLGKDKAQQKTQEAADRGTAVHTLIERHLKGEDLFQGQKFEQAHINSFNALKLKLKNIDEIWGQEVALYSDLLAVAGRCDCVGVYKGMESIIDFKTSGRLKSQKDVEDYRFQLAAYAVMHNEMFATDICDGVILMTSDAGFPQEFHVDLRQYVDPLFERVEQFFQNLRI